MDSVALIIGGGRGERFWPKSSWKKPKQFLNLIDDKPLIWHTCDRLRGFIDESDIWVIAPGDLKRSIKKALPKVKIITEPVGRNTGPAIAYAAKLLYKKYRESVMYVLPADHWIGKKQNFVKTLTIAAQYAAGGSLVTLGIKPTRPDTGYGYIQVNGKIGGRAYRVLKFKEKPDYETAKRYLELGGFYWNSGIFVWRTDSIIEEFKRQMPKLNKKIDRYIKNKKKTTYQKLPNISVDYGIMEGADDVVMIEANFEWDDLGNWNALARHLDCDEKGNVITGQVVSMDSQNSIIYADDGTIAALGIQDLIVVRTKDAVLICPRRRANEIKELIKGLTKEEK